MDPHLFDIIWEVYRESGSTQPIDVLSGYRSPQTNAMLRRRSRQVAEHSQHMQGKAIDAHFVDVGTGAHPRHRHAHAGGRRRLLSDRHDALGAYRQRLGALLAAHEPRRADPAVPRRKDGVHPRRRAADAWLRAGAGRDRGARRRGAGGERRRNWRPLLLAVRPAAAPTTREESGGQEATTAMAATRQCARRPQRRLAAAAAAVEVADVGPRGGRQGQARLAHRHRLRQAPVEPAPAARPRGRPIPGRRRSRRPSATLPTGPAYASAAGASADAAGQAAGRRGAGAAQRGQRRFADGAQRRAEVHRAPLPPRKPADLAALAFADAPMPPDSSGGSDPRFDDGPSGGAFAPPSNKRFDAGPAGWFAAARLLPPASIARRPARSRWPRGCGRRSMTTSELLARAAELTAPLPPMPIPNVGGDCADETAAAGGRQPRRRAASARLVRSHRGAGGRGPGAIVRGRLQERRAGGCRSDPCGTGQPIALRRDPPKGRRARRPKLPQRRGCNQGARASCA